MARREVEAQSETRPAFRDGDRMDVVEFERVWEFYPEIKRAELVDGEVFIKNTGTYFQSVARAVAFAWMGTYWARNADRLQILGRPTVRLLDEHDLQPHMMIRMFDGACRVLRDHLFRPAGSRFRDCVVESGP